MKKWFPALALTAIICALLASSGVAQSAIQATRVLIVDSTNTAVTPSVDATDNTAAQTTGPQVFGVASTAAPTVAGADGRSKSVWLDLNGRLRVTGDTSMTKLLVTPDSVALPANQSVNAAQINGVTPLMGAGNTGTGSPRVTIASDQAITPNYIGTSATTTDSASGCYLQSAASTNSTNCKASAGNFYGLRAINTTSTTYFLRLYNASSAPTCSSATGFIETIPIPNATGTGAGISAVTAIPIGYSTGVGFCLTGGGSSTDNTNAATGVYLTIYYK